MTTIVKTFSINQFYFISRLCLEREEINLKWMLLLSQIYLIYLNLAVNGVLPFCLLLLLNLAVWRQIQAGGPPGLPAPVKQSEVRLSQISVGIAAGESNQYFSI